ncbi:hypothetical protein EMIHUDRAFT_459515 [Emiliania huxleyi CCMP1516]|uniref:Nucleotide-diphospho-sugar transferase domain-containing protein n=2 Tax=Emiliania huxleyi TaxID=2903 RepID=A0A0D3IQZ7_EMIH1|nr:hypothetical protein EMIHUDRAFT_459515 [Emiliania huxleyi CCMP1516]EOD13682.1 hypothetical protein EMIHUDRAFT_459515 [Emiliania huxleyi CCMP1516]|eukprot:XP_005766111.1 hypothetical protein EMIHUDRAFT_459515 [Emiliania huxleyi CCMP1516]
MKAPASLVNNPPPSGLGTWDAVAVGEESSELASMLRQSLRTAGKWGGAFRVQNESNSRPFDLVRGKFRFALLKADAMRESFKANFKRVLFMDADFLVTRSLRGSPIAPLLDPSSGAWDPRCDIYVQRASSRRNSLNTGLMITDRFKSRSVLGDWERAMRTGRFNDELMDQDAFDFITGVKRFRNSTKWGRHSICYLPNDVRYVVDDWRLDAERLVPALLMQQLACTFYHFKASPPKSPSALTGKQLMRDACERAVWPCEARPGHGTQAVQKAQAEARAARDGARSALEAAKAALGRAESQLADSEAALVVATAAAEARLSAAAAARATAAASHLWGGLVLTAWCVAAVILLCAAAAGRRTLYAESSPPLTSPKIRRVSTEWMQPLDAVEFDPASSARVLVEQTAAGTQHAIDTPTSTPSTSSEGPGHSRGPSDELQLPGAAGGHRRKGSQGDMMSWSCVPSSSRSHSRGPCGDVLTVHGGGVSPAGDSSREHSRGPSDELLPARHRRKNSAGSGASSEWLQELRGAHVHRHSRRNSRDLGAPVAAEWLQPLKEMLEHDDLVQPGENYRRAIEST